MDKTDMIDRVIKIEGGYVNDPSDSGGETKYGITAAVARRNGYTGRMKDLSYADAYKIYERLYWKSLRLDDVIEMSKELAWELFDTGVNMGVGRAGSFLQRGLNVMNNGGKFYDDLNVDGAVGPKTLGALNAYYARRGVEGMVVLTELLNCLQGAFYVTLAERRQKDEKFIYGWFKHRVV